MSSVPTITAPAPMTASSSMSAPVNGRLLELDPDELGSVVGCALLDAVEGGTTELDEIDGGAQLL
ncbi:MAG: hypothetical protein WB565_13510 [Acidimicrobiales bacterium]